MQVIKIGRVDVGCVRMAEDIDQWRATEKAVMHHRGSLKRGAVPSLATVHHFMALHLWDCRCSKIQPRKTVQLYKLTVQNSCEAMWNVDVQKFSGPEKGSLFHRECAGRICSFVVDPKSLRPFSCFARPVMWCCVRRWSQSEVAGELRQLR